VGITLVSLGLGAVGMETLSEVIELWFVSLLGLFGEGPAVESWAGTLAYVVAFIGVSFVHVVGGELAPKVRAVHKAEQISMTVGGSINLMYLTFRPLIYFMKLASDLLLRLAGQGTSPDTARAGSRCPSRRSA
jgi:CBS domain containing-hemolysin-like protein